MGAWRREAASVAEWIETKLDTKVTKETFAGSSDWASNYRYDTEAKKSVFVKVALGRDTTMFTGEQQGLDAMKHAAGEALTIPAVYGVEEIANRPGRSGSFIAMECLQLSRGGSQAELGRALALMHSAEPLHEEAKQGKFGFPVDNTIGGTPQPNPWTDDWIEFYKEHRLRHQARLAGNAELTKGVEKLCDKLESYFEGVQRPIKPATLHGDLWSGNISGVDGKPCIFDPASYYGHSEAEFGMSWCAGFGDAFYQAYFDVLPREEGFEKRAQIYKLYHYLNHYNLFGSSYYSSAASILSSLGCL
ncbi:hypothetical protein PPROV_000475800 [Pycnococcus provasolii]|uniref:protein-ribulosamine 3-kinase n=2 Tax=Pycnococcus provasolii TaxID=41880 RepID=A0A830HKC8_9CHLO|nr:hypothetical protein PPROV_000475800 [Pycnococcus provasolii]